MNDLISRQDAIRWVKTECNPYGKPTLEFESGKRVIAHLEQMPSAYPEDKCSECDAWNKYKNYRGSQWIPCSERLPEEYGNYLITTYEGDVDIGTIDPNRKNVWSACNADGFYWLRNVIAWMPLPEPYKEVTE